MQEGWWILLSSSLCLTFVVVFVAVVFKLESQVVSTLTTLSHITKWAEEEALILLLLKRAVNICRALEMVESKRLRRLLRWSLFLETLRSQRSLLHYSLKGASLKPV